MKTEAISFKVCIYVNWTEMK